MEVAHLDLYRLRSLAGEDPALLDDYLTPERIGFVEWPGWPRHGSSGWPRASRLEHLGGDRRCSTSSELLGFDTSTAATSACVLRADGEAFEVLPAAGAAARAPRPRARADARGGAT